MKKELEKLANQLEVKNVPAFALRNQRANIQKPEPHFNSVNSGLKIARNNLTPKFEIVEVTRRKTPIIERKNLKVYFQIQESPIEIYDSTSTKSKIKRYFNRLLGAIYLCKIRIKDCALDYEA